MTVRSEERRRRCLEVWRWSKAYGVNTMAQPPGSERIKTGAILIRRAVLLAEIPDSGRPSSPLKLNARKHQAPGGPARGLDNGVGSLRS